MTDFRASHKISVYGDLYLYVQAPAGTNANTMAKYAREYIATLPKPEYREYDGSTRPGQWCRHLGKSFSFYTPEAEKDLGYRKLYWTTITIPEGL